MANDRGREEDTRALAQAHRELLETTRRLTEEQGKLARGASQWSDSIKDAGRQAGAVGAVISQSLAGGFEQAGGTARALTTTIAAMPGPIGQVAASTLLLANVFDATQGKARRLEAAVSSALGSIVRGSQNAAQAIAQIRIDVLTSKFERIQARVVDVGFFARLERGADNLNRALRGQDRPTQLQRFTEQIPEALAAAEAAQRRLMIWTQSPAVRQFVNQVNLLQARQAAATTQTGAYRSAFGEQAAASALEMGSSAESAADAAARMNLVFDRANQIMTTQNIPATQALEQANNELWASLERLAQAQNVARGAQATRQLEEQNRASREQVQILQAQTQMVRAQGTSQIAVVDQSREQLEVQRLRQRGLITEETANRRLQQLNAERIAQEEQGAAAAGQAMIRQNQTARERFQQSQRDIATIDVRGGFRTAGGQADPVALLRAQAGSIREFVQQNRPQERLLGLTEAGTAAGAIASARAEIQERAEDPAIALRAAIEASRMQEQALERSNRDLIAVYQQLQQEGAL